MSHLDHIQSQATKEEKLKIDAWAKYEAAQAEFEKHRQKLIHSIMEIKNEQGVDFYHEMQKRINYFNNHKVMDRIAKSVVTGEALEEIHLNFVDENVHQGKECSHSHEEQYITKEELTIEEEIEKVGVFTNEQRPTENFNPKEETDSSVAESKIEEINSNNQYLIEGQNENSEPLKETLGYQAANQTAELSQKDTNIQSPIIQEEIHETKESKVHQQGIEKSIMNPADASQPPKQLGYSASLQEETEEKAEEKQVEKVQQEKRQGKEKKVDVQQKGNKIKKGKKKDR